MVAPLDWVGWLELVLGAVAVLLGLAVLLPAAYQAYLDHCSDWPYETPFIGRPHDPIGPWVIVLAFRFENLTTREAYFEIRYTSLDDNSAYAHLALVLPSHVSVWPSQEKVGLWLTIPPKSSREVRVSPFSPSFSDHPEKWSLSIVEYRHRKKPVVLRWPEDLDKPVNMLATDIPMPTK